MFNAKENIDFKLLGSLNLKQVIVLISYFK